VFGESFRVDEDEGHRTAILFSMRVC